MEERKVLSESNRNDVIKYSLRSLTKNVLIGGTTALALSAITKKKWLGMFALGYGIGKTVNECDVYLKAKLDKI